MKKQLNDISIIRSFCIIVVVFFHCYGMMYAPGHFPNTILQYKALYFDVNQRGLINVAMPLFVFISGYLFYHLLMLGKYSTWKTLLRKKTIRILLPYVVFSLFFMLTTDSCNLIQLLRGGYWHLWFLPMLFWCFVIGYGIYRMKLNIFLEMMLIILLVVVPIDEKKLPNTIMGIGGALNWFYRFYMGILFCKYRDIFFSYIHRYKLYLPLLVFYVVAIVVWPSYYGAGNNGLISRLSHLSFCIAACYLMSLVDWDKYQFVSPIIKLSVYTFGIYIWHNWVALMLISNTSKQLFGLSELAANHVVLFPLCFSLITLFISWFLSWCMMKTKIGKFLIG